MAYYYSAAERAFFSSELMSVDAMPSDKVAVADQTYKKLMADQVAGKLIRTGSGNAPESVDQGLTAATRFGDVSFGKVTGTNLDINGNGDVSGTFVVGGAVTIKGSLNAQGGLNVTSITATGTSTLAAVNATNLSLSGTLKVNGASTLQAVSAKKITATEIDLNGSMDASGNVVVHGKTTLEALQANGDVNVGGLLKVTGTINANRLIQEGSTPMAIRIPDTEKGTVPSETRSNGIDFFDAEGVVGTSDRLGILRVQYSSSGSSSFSIGATQPTAGSTLNSEIKVGWRLNGSSYERYTEAPTPPSGDESTQIATTDFVNALIDKYGLGMRIGRSGCGYINDANEVPGSGFYSVAASSANVPVSTTCLLHVQRWADNGSSGFQLIPSATGKRMFLRIKGGSQGWGDWLPLVTQDWEYDFSAIEVLTKRSADTVRLLAQNLSVTKGTHPTAGKYWDFRACDSEGRNVANSLGGMSVAYTSDGAVSTRIIAYKPEHGSSTGASIIVGFDAEGNIVTSAPAPVTSSDDNSIATTAWVRALFEAGLGSAIPSGVAFPYAGKTVPSGFMACNGGTISRTTYAKLFAAIGTAWGAGDGSTTFKLPDWRNRTVMGANSASEVGTYLESGAPNITGSFVAHYQGNPVSGAFQATGTGRSKSGTDGDGQAISFDASRSNPIYGAADIIQPPSGKALWIIKL